MAVPLLFTQSKASCQIRVLVQYVSDTRFPFAELAIERSGALDTPAAEGASAHTVEC